MINLTLSSTNDDDDVDGKMNGNQSDDNFQRIDDDDDDDDFGMSLSETNSAIKQNLSINEKNESN